MMTYNELERRRGSLKAKLDAAAQKIAGPRITEAARKQIAVEAERIIEEKAAIRDELNSAIADRDAHAEKEPEKPWLLRRGEWEWKHERWEAQRDAMQKRVEELWEKAGGDM
ncbi:MAG: hypothetical protein LBT65_00275, partial [Synergistaceae bacterium]|nr:hypothetical protein [Synergistaceae bacterium]